jgi:glutamine synthetase
VGAYKVWGMENKEAPMRLLHPLKPTEGATNFEIKSFDHTANHYFAVAAVIAMGMRGLTHKTSLPEQYTKDADLLPEEKRNSLGIEKLPATF